MAPETNTIDDQSRKKGRQPGAKSPLRKGERQTVELLNQAIESIGESDPIVQMCMEILVKMAHGSGLRRHASDQYRAIRDLLDRRLGTPTQEVQHAGEISHRVTIVDDPDGAG